MTTCRSRYPDVSPDTLSVLTEKERSEALQYGGPSANGRLSSVLDIFQQAQIIDDLQEVERVLLARTASHSPLIAAAGRHTVSAGGKRLRAALALLAARLGEYDLERAIPAATTVEFIHAASLVHDDLVDQAARRRGHITVHARWDNDVALMVGDYFFALGASEMARSPDSRTITYYAQAVQTTVEGELSPVTVLTPRNQALEQYFYKIGCKTAALFEAACKSGMAAGRGSEDDIAALGHFGYAFGLAFQIVDDILDFTSDETTLGKPAGNDLRQGTITLPLIYAVENGGSSLLREIIDMPDATDEQIARAVTEVIERGGVDRARADAALYAQRAIAHLERFPPSAARAALIDLTLFTVQRQM